ncbi:MAG TPA: hypothetical protein VFF23_05820 [Hanamia sp.]|jgi:hypothetical protein|nr:hypothetical protein [Hanamia sp.]
METSIRINTDNLSKEFLEGIKAMFPHKMVEITIQPADDTEYILNNPEYASELMERIEEYKAKKKTVSVNPADLL